MNLAIRGIDANLGLRNADSFRQSAIGKAAGSWFRSKRSWILRKSWRRKRASCSCGNQLLVQLQFCFIFSMCR